MPDKRLLIVWWSNTGGTASLAEAARHGAQTAALTLKSTDPGSPELDVQSVRCDLLSLEALLQADGLVLATPECLGSVAGPMKTWLDRSYYPALDQLSGRPYAAIVCAGTDGEGALRMLDRVAAGWRLRRAAPALKVITGAQTPEAIASPKRILQTDLGRANELGATLGAGLLMGLW
ncbi:MAG: NAD(P)H-dependent oxidoreductase [Burkholderiales bacterium]|nr:NAD(P)H-dependent oxidoreductase [Burkholderiales bacterium]